MLVLPVSADDLRIPRRRLIFASGPLTARNPHDTLSPSLRPCPSRSNRMLSLLVPTAAWPTMSSKHSTQAPPAKPRIVRPDGIVSFCREHIRIALSSESPALPYTINSYTMTLRSKNVFVWYGLNNGMSPLSWQHQGTWTADSSSSS